MSKKAVAATGIEALMGQLHRSQRLFPHHMWAGTELIRWLRVAEGQSFGVVDPTAERVHGAGGGDLPYVVGERLGTANRVVLDALREHERETLNFMILYKDVAGANLAQFGRKHSTYQDRESASAFAVSRILATLDSVCEIRGYERLRPS